MPYCSRCGVEVDSHVENCPLCTAPIQRFPELQAPSSGPWPLEGDTSPARYFSTPDEIRSRVLLLVTFVLFVGALTVLAVDFYTSGGFTWSWVPLVSICAAFLYLVVGLNQYHAFLTLTTGYMVITAGFLFALDQLTTGKSWFLPLGLPILISLFVVLCVSYLFILNMHRKGFNVLGVILASGVVFTTLVDLMIQLFLTDSLNMTWSLLTTFIGLPTTLYLFYLHYGLKKYINLHRTFHV